MPLWISTSSAKGNEPNHALQLIDQITIYQLKPNNKMLICEADKGYDSDFFRQKLLSKCCIPLIGYRKHRKFKLSTGKTAQILGITRKRWVVERSFAWLKRKCRRLIMRWERLPQNWEAFNLLGLIYIWIGYLFG